MGAYLIRRLLLVIPTLWAIITINFFIVQIAPGGPVDQAQAVKVFVPAMRKRVSAISATVITVVDAD